MFRDRVETLRDHLLHNVVDDRFNLQTWAGCDTQPWRGMQDLSCGTTACAMGWAATIPSFQALGLHLKPIGGSKDYGQIAFDGTIHFQAAAKFLDLSADDTEYLFSSEKYENEEETTRLEVVERITNFLLHEHHSNYDASQFNSSGDPVSY